jgi:hypothetical protein
MLESPLDDRNNRLGTGDLVTVRFEIVKLYPHEGRWLADLRAIPNLDTDRALTGPSPMMHAIDTRLLDKTSLPIGDPVRTG